MAKIIILTSKNTRDKIFVAADKILYFESVVDGTFVYLMNGKSIRVEESPDEVMGKI